MRPLGVSGAVGGEWKAVLSDGLKLQLH